MVFVRFEVEKMIIFFSSVNSSLVLGLSAVVECSSFLSRVKDRFQLAPVSWPSCRQQASLFMQGHGRPAFPILLQILLLFQILGHRCIFEGIKDPPFKSLYHSPSQKFKVAFMLLNVHGGKMAY